MILHDWHQIWLLSQPISCNATAQLAFKKHIKERGAWPSRPAAPWITPLVVFTHAFVKFGPPVKGVRVVNARYLLKTLQSGQSRSTTIAAVWQNREQIVRLLTGQPLLELTPAHATSNHCCPKCGKTMIAKVAKGGSQAGKHFWVCPDDPGCKTAIPIEK